MRSLTFLLLLSLFLFSNENNYKVSKNLEISGLVLNKLNLDVKELEELSYFKSGSTPVICMSGETKDNVESYEGVLLKDLLDKAVLNISSRKDLNKVYIHAISTDGYETIFSYNEIFNTKLGDNIIVFYKKNGKYLEDYQGKIALISIDDIRNGPRHIKWLEKIIVGKI
ncbi:Oxidoreductase molybdopterin binding domain protein [Arcobacter porcinus]|uniref:molybdopterin-dependent oxidoreductase n=1 Tax=Arcobacter porcinus TaxID=1935204 RepID=UPI000827E7DF|nr:molybdopterin-dependent oxidoreductase [Arcobacter porcinus]OCL84269.1 Oxidoreductase molybdopterin binding domain protein [Arcobacter porcinus]